jgi:hypothetical protein
MWTSRRTVNGGTTTPISSFKITICGRQPGNDHLYSGGGFRLSSWDVFAPESVKRTASCSRAVLARVSTPRGEVGVQSEAEAMLLDRYLPQYDVTETHAVVVDADTDLTWQAVRRSDLSRSAVIRVLLEMRSLPNRLQRVLTRRPPGPARPPLTLDDMERAGFLLLGESPGREIVFGTVVQPWKAVTDDEPAPQVDAGRFAAFDTPGYVKVAFNIRVEPYGSGRALITTETRTAATDPTSLRRFARYWLFFGPFSALIRRLTLRIVKSDAEGRPGLMSTTRPPDG